MKKNKVLVVGGGVSGLTAALELSCLGYEVILTEKSPFIGGHAAQLSCKATTSCVKCGTCLVEEKIAGALSDPKIRILTQSRIVKADPIHKDHPIAVHIQDRKSLIDPNKCSSCGKCKTVCPVEDAIVSATSGYHQTSLGIAAENCMYFNNGSCRLCEINCPEKAIHLDNTTGMIEDTVDAVVIATGFKAYEPLLEPYGFRRFQNVVTNLMLETKLRENGRVLRPSDGVPPRHVAFIQCIGSRNEQLNHLWCSQVCCGSSLRLANLILHREPNTEVTIFYIDIQNFQKNMSAFGTHMDHVTFVRSIPGDIFELDDNNLKVSFFETDEGQSKEAAFDLVSLANGMTPSPETEAIASMFGITDCCGFSKVPQGAAHDQAKVFFTGTTCGPMSVSVTIAHTKAVIGDLWRRFGRQ